MQIKEALILFIKNYEGNNAVKVNWLVNAKTPESRHRSLLFNSNSKKNHIADLNSLGQDPKYQGLKLPFDIDLTQIGLPSKIYSNQASFLSSNEVENLKIFKCINLNNDSIIHKHLPLDINTKEIKQNDLLAGSMIEASDINIKETRIQGNIINMTILLERLEINRSNAKKDLIYHFKQQLCESSQYIIWDMISIFKEKFNTQYRHFLSPINKEELIMRHDSILEELRNIIRAMKKIVKKFLRYLFKSKIDKLVDNQEHENSDINIILNSITYQLIFDDANELSTHYKLIYELLKIKYENKMNNYLEAAHKLLKNKIQSYDDSLNDIFWLQNVEKPYHPIILLLRNMHKNMLNPFHKFEFISVIDEEIAKYLEVSYRQQNQTDKVEHLLMTLKELDFQYSIINYCIVQSLNENLILDLYFMKEFINEKFRESSFQFIEFERCLIDYITSGKILEKVEPNILKNSLKSSSKTDKTSESTSPTTKIENSDS